MRVRDIIGLILALVLAVGVAFLTRIFLTKEEKPKQETALKPAQITRVIVAGQNLSPGDKIKAGSLVWQEWPQNNLTPAYLTEETTKIDEFTGSIVRFPIHKGNPVLKEELVNPKDKGLLAAIVSPGKRAISIDVTASASDSGLIFPGDHVDVILSETVSEANMQVGKSKTILKDVKVLAFDIVLAAPETAPKTPPHVATLEVTPAQAEILMAGVKQGALSLSLHSLEAGEVQSSMETPLPAEKKPEEKKIILMRGKEKSEIQFQEK